MFPKSLNSMIALQLLVNINIYIKYKYFTSGEFYINPINFCINNQI